MRFTGYSVNWEVAVMFPNLDHIWDALWFDGPMSKDSVKKPVILLDKSVLHSLSFADLKILRLHFFVNLPPILVAEILADRRKDSGQAVVAELFSKLRTLNPIPCCDWETLCGQSLFGWEPPVGRVPTDHSLTLVDGHVHYGPFVPYTIKIIDDGIKGVISDEDAQAALAWKAEADLEIDLGSLRNTLQSLSLGRAFTSRFKSAIEVRTVLDTFLTVPDARQEALLGLLSNKIKLQSNRETEVIIRWERSGKGLLRDFAPYAFTCLRTFMLFHFALRDGIISEKNTNRIDLEYFLYAPFCRWFVSNDRFHKRLYPAALDGQHVFADGGILKQNLQGPKWLRTSQFNFELPVFFGIDHSPE